MNDIYNLFSVCRTSDTRLKTVQNGEIYRMKITSMFHVLTFLTATLIFSVPLMVLAQEVPLPEMSMPIPEEAKAIADAQRDAEAHLNKPLWFAVGCFLPMGVGLLVPYFHQKTPPAAALLGKSPTYVAHYTDTYKRQSQSHQFQSAAMGCLIGTGVSVVGIILMNAAASSPSYGYYGY